MLNDQPSITSIEWTEIYLLCSRISQQRPQMTTLHHDRLQEIIAFLIYLSKNMETANPEILHSRESQLVRSFMELLKKNFAKNKMVNDYAGQLYVSANYLNRTVKKITGFTASYHIQQHIISEAKRQALYSSVSMKEIAYNLGFDNLAHFSKFFKNNAGMNFTCFKKSITTISQNPQPAYSAPGQKVLSRH